MSHVNAPQPALGSSSLFHVSRSSAPALRIGVLLDAGSVPAFARSILDDLLQAGYVRLVVAATVGTSGSSPEPVRRPALLVSLYRRLIESRFPATPDPLAPVDCLKVLAASGVPVLQLAPHCADAPLDQTARQELAGLQLDVLLDFTAGGVRASGAVSGRGGVWRYRFADSRTVRAGPPYLRESLQAQPLSGIELLRVAERWQDDVVLCRALFDTSPFPSAAVNSIGPVWGGQHFVIRKLWELHECGPEYLAARAEHTGAERYAEGAVDDSPTNFEMLRWLAGQAARRLVRKLQRRVDGVHWSIAVRRSSTPLHEDPGETELRRFRWLQSPPGHFWADPFLFEQDGQTWLFFEDMDHAVGHAHISCGRLDDNGGIVDVRPVLQRPYHLSYPQVIAADGEIYMIPEGSESGGVDLYRALSFPDRWVHERRLLDFKCVDSTLFHESGRWWMVTSPMVINGHAAISWLFVADRITGPWAYNPVGPVSQDESEARGAGNIFRWNGRLIRPSQDCSRGYGRALIFNEITRLDAGSYRERRIARIDGSWLPGLQGVHTYNRVGDREVIDGQFLIRKSSTS